MSWHVSITNPNDMGPLLKEKRIENVFFKKALRNISSKQFDELVHHYANIIEPQIDCTQCANCCKKLDPEIDELELEIIAQQKQLAIEQFKQQYLAFDGSAHYLHTKPCIFLVCNNCSIYQLRPNTCKEYPHLNQQEMKYKLTFWDNYSICPIVFNTVEAIKKEIHFSK